MDRLAALASMNRRLWHNCVLGTEPVLWSRPLDSVNALGFLAIHLIDSRYFVLKLVGAERANPFTPLLEGASSMADLEEHPGIEPLVAAWEEVSRHLETALLRLTAAELASRAPQRFPNGHPTLAGALDFLLSHESYHIGQMALLRRCFGLPPMRYT